MKAMIVCILSSIIPIICFVFFPDTIISMIGVIIISIISVALFVYFLGLNMSERAMVNDGVSALLKKIIRGE